MEYEKTAFLFSVILQAEYHDTDKNSHTFRFRLYRSLYAKENGLVYDPRDAEFAARADLAYPLPEAPNFRMH